MTTASLSPRRGSRDSRRKPAPTAAFSPPPPEPRFQAAMQGGEYVQSRASSTAWVESADVRRTTSRVISRLAATELNEGTKTQPSPNPSTAQREERGGGNGGGRTE